MSAPTSGPLLRNFFQAGLAPFLPLTLMIAFAARIRGNVDIVKVEESCVDDPVTVDVETDLGTAVTIMLDRRVDSVLITETEGDTEPKLAGIFTLRDAARVLHNQLTLRL